MPGYDDPWGVHQAAAPHPDPPEPLPPPLAKLAEITSALQVEDWAEWDSPGPQALPEVAALLADGWCLLGPDQRYSLLPAVWPAQLRCWLPDRMPKVWRVFDGGSVASVITDDEHRRLRNRDDDPSADAAAELAEQAGLPAPPPDRIWLLRSPWPRLGVQLVLRMMSRRCAALHLDEYDAPDIVIAAQDLLRWDDNRLRTLLTDEEVATAQAWETAGRTGEDVVELVIAGVGPHDLDRLPGLSPEQAVAWRWAAGADGTAEAVDRVVFLRSLGLAAEPPADLYRLERLTDDDFRAWWEAGFDVPSMVQMLGLTVDQAVSWRRHGYPPAQVEQLLRADAVLTPAEADAFTRAGIVGQHQVDWIGHGFTAADAAAFDELDIQPNEARVWRSMGLRPADAAAGQKLPAGYQRGGWTMPAGARLRDAQHSVQDPPGTRGAVARSAMEVRRRHRDR